MKLFSATTAAIALALSLGLAPEADAQFSRKDYPQDRDRTTASTRTDTRDRSPAPRERASTRTERPRTSTAPRRTAPRRRTPARTAPRRTTAPPPYCPPPRTVYNPPRPTRVVYRDRAPVRYGAGFSNLSRSERRAYQQRLTARAERLANWEVELTERQARRSGRSALVSRRERRAIAARYFPYGTNTGVLRARELEDWDYFLEEEALALSRREEALRGRSDRRRRGRDRDRRSSTYCPPGGW